MTLNSLFKDISADIKIDMELNRRVASWKNYFRPLVVPQLCCLLIYRISRYLYLQKMVFISKILRNINIILFGADIQPEASIKGGCFIGHSVGIVIGPNVTIDEGCLIFHGVTLTPGTQAGLELSVDDTLLIGKRVKIYSGAKILGNLTIESDVTIGANAVVLNSIPSGTTVVGIPARPINK